MSNVDGQEVDDHQARWSCIYMEPTISLHGNQEISTCELPPVPSKSDGIVLVGALGVETMCYHFHSAKFSHVIVHALKPPSFDLR